MTQGVLSKDTLFCPGGFGLTGGGNDGSPVEDSAPEFPVGRQGGIQPLPKARIAFQHGHIVDGIGQGFRRTDQHADLFGARDTRIDQVALEHHEVGHQHRHDHNRVFRPLRLMNRRGVGQRQFVEFRDIVLDPFAVEIDFQRPLLRIHLPDITQIAVEHILVVVVALLHHTIALTIGIAAAAEARPRRIQCLLQQQVQVRGVHDTAVIVEISHGQCRHLAGRAVGCQVLRSIDALAALPLAHCIIRPVIAAVEEWQVIVLLPIIENLRQRIRPIEIAPQIVILKRIAFCDSFKDFHWIRF